MTLPKPSLSKHVELAADIHRAEDAVSKLLSRQTTMYLYAREQDRLIKTYNSALGRLKCRLEDTMFASYPQLPDGFIRLYYGDEEDFDALSAAASEYETVTAPEPDVIGSCEYLADECERLARRVERMSWPAGQAVYNAAANLSDAAEMLRHAI